MNHISRSLQLFFIDGRPDGVVTGEIANWSGKIISFPKSAWAIVKKREDAKQAGVYLLIEENSDQSSVYIGQTQNFVQRFTTGKYLDDENWERAVLITNMGSELNAAQTLGLERHLFDEAKLIGDIEVRNKSVPSGAKQSDVDKSFVELFFDHLKLALPAMRVQGFNNKVRATSPTSATQPDFHETQFEFTSKEFGTAKAVWDDGEIIVLKGSDVRFPYVGKDNGKGKKVHKALCEKGIIAGHPNGTNGVFTKDYGFPSPSQAAAVVSGRSANGRTSWKVVGTGQTYADWEDAQLSEADQ